MGLTTERRRGVSKDLLLNNECIKILSLVIFINCWCRVTGGLVQSSLQLFNPCEDLSVGNNMVYFIYYPPNCFNLAFSENMILLPSQGLRLVILKFLKNPALLECCGREGSFITFYHQLASIIKYNLGEEREFIDDMRIFFD